MAIDSGQSNGDAAEGGAAYLFGRVGKTWIQDAYIKASNTDPGDYYGISVVLFDDIAVIGATGEASSSQNRDGTRNGMPWSGAAYVY